MDFVEVMDLNDDGRSNVTACTGVGLASVFCNGMSIIVSGDWRHLEDDRTRNARSDITSSKENEYGSIAHYGRFGDGGK